MRELGVDVSGIAPAAPPAHVEVWPEHWDTVRLFLRTCTQWRPVSTPAGIARTSLDYTAVRNVADDMGLTPVNWAALQVMEIEALHILNSGDA